MAGDAPKEAHGRIMHTSLQADGMTLFGSDLMPGMPFAKTFWAEGFGMLVDQFGVPWMVNCEH